MTARQHVGRTLKGIEALGGRVYFLERPADGGYPCAIYTPAGNRFLDHLKRPAATYASWYSVEVRAKSSGLAESLAEEVLRAFERGQRMERRRDLSFMFDDADAGQVSSDAYGVYRAMSGYLIRESG